MGKNYIFFLIFGIGFLSLGAIAKKKDAVQLTQTDPIAYQEKLKEEEEGKKGPPAPTLELFPKERFLADPPVEHSKEVAPEEAPDERDLWLEEEGEEFKLEEETDDTSETDENWEPDDFWLEEEEETTPLP